MQKTIFTFGAMLCILMSQGCKYPPASLISNAIASTNVLFKPNLQDPITLSVPQANTIKRIVGSFSERSNVRIEKDILPHESGRFILGNSHFGWLGRTLYIHDYKAGKYYVVEDAALGEMAKVFFKAQGQPPLKNPSPAQWQEILSVLGTDR